MEDERPPWSGQQGGGDKQARGWRPRKPSFLKRQRRTGTKHFADIEQSLSVHWELMFTRGRYHTPDMAEQHRVLSEVSALVDKFREDYGPINAANRAHAAVEGGRGYGKIVLSGF